MVGCGEVNNFWQKTFRKHRSFSGKKYLYIKKKIIGKLTSKYVDVYLDGLYQLLSRNAREGRELFLVIPEKQVPAFKKELVKFYEGEGKKALSEFMKGKCWKNF